MSLGLKNHTTKIREGKSIENIGYEWLLLVPLSILCFTFFAPLISVIYSSFFGPVYQPAEFDMSGYDMLFSDFFHILIRTLKFAIVTTAASILLSLPIAFFMRDSGSLARKLSIFILITPLMVNIIIRNYGWIVLLYQDGVFNKLLIYLGVIDSPLNLVRNEIGVYIGLIHVFLPFTALPIYDVLMSIDSSIQEAARVHGASRSKTFLFVTLPNLLPGIIAGGTIVFVLSLGIYVTPVIMSGNTITTLPMTMRQFTTQLLDWRFVSASATILLLIAAVTIGTVSKVTGVTSWR